MARVTTSKIMQHSSFIPFNQSMLPGGILLTDILRTMDFLSPEIVILHGSSVSKMRFSPLGNMDLDIICASRKAPFWSLENLYERYYELMDNENVNVDLTILSHSGLLAVLKDTKTSLNDSINNGFTILHKMEDFNEF
ncbi:MAG: hypothetical protein Q7I98_05115 [Erysipelotrichaceae bacterium]|nr:hypothetical protein [Erysipelotrichaceae bacterium]